MASDHLVLLDNNICCYCFILFVVVSVCRADWSDDVSCLKSIKKSVEDPLNYLGSSWDFRNNTPGFICKFIGVECWHTDENRVLSLRLSDMGLRGEFPRGLELCTSLTGLDLSNNQLKGPIPFHVLGKLFLTSLDLSNNHFSGTIQPEISRCRFLNVLRLDNNQLTGRIPREIGWMDHIKTFSVSNNRLTGAVPVFMYNNVFIPPESYQHNLGLCGGPLEPCSSTKNILLISWESMGGFFIGWPFGFFVFMLSYCFGLPKINKLPNNPLLGLESDAHHTSGTQTLKISRLEKYVTRMKLEELIKVTSSFSLENFISVGNSGITYKAFLENGSSLAIKSLFISQVSEEQFISELMILGTQRHANLLPLLGFCIENGERYLVYKYMPNGSLYQHLRSMEGLSWPLRMKIALGIANGLAWLHHSWRVRVSHCNINSRSILLDQNFEPKISNFWEAKISSPNASNWSLFSSFESFSQQLNPDKQDVYCFGLLLHEIIMAGTMGWTELESINSWSCDDSNSSLCDAAFCALLGKGNDEMRLQFYAVAKDCVKRCANQRPTMIQVHQRLKAITLRFENA